MILRICLCVPTFNNPDAIAKVATELLEETDFPVLIVDDGSHIPVIELLNSRALVSALESGRLRILRIPVNRGKGFALQSAFKECLSLGFTHLFSIDGDGQHLVSEVPKLVESAKKYPWDLIVGRRKLSAATVPGVSRFGRAFSNYWVNYQTGHPIEDSQSGFRLYPLFQVQTMDFKTRRYDFEIEVLIRLLWKNIGVQEVEIDVFYPEKHLRVSHFDKLWDNARISILNTVLVIISLMRAPTSARETGIAFGAGIFIGCTPFYGLHTLIVGLVSFLLRLNAGIVFLASNIAIPPLAPFLIMASIYLGNIVLSNFSGLDISNSMLILPTHVSFTEFLEWASAQALPWLVGSVVLGTLLGLLSGLTVYIVGSTVTKKKNANWNGRMRGGKFGNGFLRVILKTFGLRSGYLFLFFIVPYFYLFAPKARRGVKEYWKILEPKRSESYRFFKAMKHFFRFGQVLMDQVVQLHANGSAFTTRPSGIEHILEASDEKRGLILLSAHVGSWSLAANLLKDEGFSGKLTVIEYRADQMAFDEIKGAIDPEKSAHLSTFSPNRNEQSIFSIHQMLGKGQPLGLMGDRPTGGRFELVPFFERLAPFDVTPFRIAAATCVPLVITFGFKAEGRVYDFYSTQARQYKYSAGVSREVQCREWAAGYAGELEKFVRKYPDQWFNFFPFWSAKPEAPPGMKASTAQCHLIEELQTRATQELASGSDSR